MTRYVWLLWDHEEDGPEEMFAFADREKAMEWVRITSLIANSEREAILSAFPADTKLDEEIAWELNYSAANSWNLQKGWGGWHLTVTGITE